MKIVALHCAGNPVLVPREHVLFNSKGILLPFVCNLTLFRVDIRYGEVCNNFSR